MIVCILVFAGSTSAYAAFEFGESFGLYTNDSPMDDESAQELDPNAENAPVGGGAAILLAMGGAYAYRVYQKRKAM